MKPREFCQEPGYDKAVLLTYDFDALFFERVVLPDLWVGGSTDVQVIADLGQVTESLPRWIGQVRQLGQRYQLTCANLSGAFHPKMLLRTGTAGGVVWIGSGNVTHGGWGCNLEVGTAWRVGPGAGDQGGWLRDVLTQFGQWLPSGVNDTVYRRILETPWLATANDTSAGCTIFVSQKQNAISKQLLARWQGRRFDQVIIVTGSTDEQGAVLEWFHESFGVSNATILLDPAMASFDPRKLADLHLQITLVTPRTPRTVHAKLYWFEGADGPAAVMGSANCSKAAWSLLPGAGGNIETVVVYDHPSKADFADILSRIGPDETETAHLIHSQKEKGNDHDFGPVYSVAEISWERLMGDVMVVFAEPLPGGAAVSLRIGGQCLACSPHRNTLVWSATLTGDPFRVRGTVFGEVAVALADGRKLALQRFWINDLAELRSSARGRGIGDSIRNLGRPHPTSEYQKILAELQRIGIALLNDSSLFSDPLSRHTKPEVRPKGDDNGVWPPVDPEQLIRSLAELGTDHVPAGISGLTGITLSGVMRALFECTDTDEDLDAVNKYEDPDGEPPLPPPQPPKHGPGKGIPPPTPPPANAKQKLRKEMDGYITKLAAPQFAKSCTVTQLVQAAAYPLAVIANGRRGGWIDAACGQEWTTRVFDTLFCRGYPEGGIGLLDTVRKRCEPNGQVEAFRRIVGDGTLWTALLDGLCRTTWKGTNSGIRKALALRTVLLSQPLLASAERGRMSVLINNLAGGAGPSPLLASARNATALLTELEGHISAEWDRLAPEHTKQPPLFCLGDALYHRHAGWAFVIGQAEASEETKVRVYRQNSASEIKVTVPFYFNVTRASQADTGISGWLKKLDESVNT